MEENVITGIVIAGNIYNVMPNGVKCPQCAVKDYCLRGKLGSKVQFDCASVHLEKINIVPDKVDINILKKSMPSIMPNFSISTVSSGKKCNI
jgi:hypothetical protein